MSNQAYTTYSSNIAFKPKASRIIDVKEIKDNRYKDLQDTII